MAVHLQELRNLNLINNHLKLKTMGTRSLTIVHDGLEKTSPRIIKMYRQMDGYPSGHGMQLAELLSEFTVVNGIGLADNRKIANGTGCLAAQIVAHFKDGAEGFYLEPPMPKGKPGDSGEEYIYNVFADTFNTEAGIKLSCYDVYGKKEIFNGTPAEFVAKYSKEEPV